jgi:hypothetical protein
MRQAAEHVCSVLRELCIEAYILAWEGTAKVVIGSRLHNYFLTMACQLQLTFSFTSGAQFMPKLCTRVCVCWSSLAG